MKSFQHRNVNKSHQNLSNTNSTDIKINTTIDKDRKISTYRSKYIDMAEYCTCEIEMNIEKLLTEQKI